MKFEEMTPEQQDAWKKHQMWLAEEYQRKAEQKAAIKLADEYSERFGGMYSCVFDADTLERMTLSLKTGVDQFVDVKRQQQEHWEKHRREQEEWDENHRREQEEFLARPITPEMIVEYTKLIKRRRLYEGACDLSWQRYFDYVATHPEIVLTPEDREYAGQWTSCATAK
jgi:hypothetical protein